MGYDISISHKMSHILKPINTCMCGQKCAVKIMVSARPSEMSKEKLKSFVFLGSSSIYNEKLN